jgi:ABC-type phosphate transport system ATPase subunit
MILSESAQKSLDFIRVKVVNQQYDIRGIEAQCLAEVFEEIQLKATGRKVTLNIGCNGCIKTAVNVVYNFIQQHEERKGLNTANVTKIEVNKPALSLTQLREKHPHIKATSVKVFMQKLEDEKTI